MKSVFLPKTPETPSVRMDVAQAYIELEGNSYPENAFEFYQQIFDWIDEYFAHGADRLRAIFRLNYLNTSSAKCMLNFMALLQQYHAQDKIISVEWHYEEDDDDMLEIGKAFSVDFTMPFQLVPFSE
ncbi:MAG: DUF1987 domain-containing protein [Bacteroidota bacterium]|nr:DUF1987 domain-containing protein [Candidatus Kapabacteria bacterium]MDW8220262.1 DUF1987 domain-containing protein [Bacteroidota bacterium]